MNRTALITGGARRIGRGIALALAREGYNIIIHFSGSGKAAKNLEKELIGFGIQAFCLRANLLEDKEINLLIDRACQIIGKNLTLLVNNASIFEEDTIQTMTMDSWDRHMYTNLKAPTFLSQLFAKQVSKHNVDDNGEFLSNANIINIIDQKVLNINPKFMSYTLAKSGLWSLTKLAAQALGPDIRVNAIGPGPILKAYHQTDDHFQKQRRSTLLGRGSDVDEICRAVIFILSSPGLTGQMLTLDGGEHLKW